MAISVKRLLSLRDEGMTDDVIYATMSDASLPLLDVVLSTSDNYLFVLYQWYRTHDETIFISYSRTTYQSLFKRYYIILSRLQITLK